MTNQDARYRIHELAVKASVSEWRTMGFVVTDSNIPHLEGHDFKARAPESGVVFYVEVKTGRSEQSPAQQRTLRASGHGVVERWQPTDVYVAGVRLTGRHLVGGAAVRDLRTLRQSAEGT